MANVITVELGLQGLDVIGQEEAEDGVIVVLVRHERTRMDCPRCKRATAKIHDRRIQGIARQARRQTVKSTAEDFGVGERFARECFWIWAKSEQGSPDELPRYLGIDDYSLRKRRRYETIVCNLEARQVLASLHGRDGNSLQEWLVALGIRGRWRE